MSLTTHRWRYFFAHQDSKQEDWLQEQARRGLLLVGPGLFRFDFVQGPPREEKYRLDFQTLRGARREEYLGLFRDAGWEFLGQVANRYYFRARGDAFSPEIFSDSESRKARIRRQMSVAAAITAILSLEVSLGASQLLRRFAGETPRASMGASVLTLLLAGAFASLGIWVLWSMEQAYKRER